MSQNRNDRAEFQERFEKWVSIQSLPVRVVGIFCCLVVCVTTVALMGAISWLRYRLMVYRGD